MAQYCILGKRINKLSIPKTYDINKIQLGVVVIENEAKKVGLAEVGDTVLPSGRFGIYSRKNAYGCTYADKTKPKERRYVSTNWIHLAIPMLQRLRLMYIRNAILKLKLQHME